MARKSRQMHALSPDCSSSHDFVQAAIYARLSDEDGDSEQNSIVNQNKIIEDFLSFHPDILPIRRYADNGYTGMNYDRPDFQRMMQDIAAGEIQCVLVKDISRLGRHFSETCRYVEQTFPQNGIRLICINDDYDSADPAANASALTMPLKMVMNDYYVKDISRKIRSSISAKMEAGEFIPSCGSIPYGYLRNGEENTFSIDAETAPVVQRIFAMRCEGTSLNAIARQLNIEGIPSPGKIRFLRGMTAAEKYKNALWIPGTLRKILSNSVYTGNRIHGKIKRDKIGMKKYARPEEDWLVLDHAHPPIISAEVFSAAQDVRRSVQEKREQFLPCAPAAADTRELFRGKLFCGDCGKPMSAGKGCARHNSHTPSRIFFDCSGYRASRHLQCSSHYIRQEDVEKAVINTICQQLKTCADLRRLIQKAEHSPKSKAQHREAQEHYHSLCVRERNMEAKSERLLMDLTEHLLNREEYLFIKGQYEERLSALRIEKANALAHCHALENACHDAKDFLQTVEKCRTSPQLNREIIELLIEQILVYPQRHIQIILRYQDPYAPLQTYLQGLEVHSHAG